MPNLQGKQMGQVITTLTVTNRIDQVLAERGFIPAEEVRSCTLDDVLVDTGATMLCLPAAIIIDGSPRLKVGGFRRQITLPSCSPINRTTIIADISEAYQAH